MSRLTQAFKFGKMFKLQMKNLNDEETPVVDEGMMNSRKGSFVRHD